MSSTPSSPPARAIFLSRRRQALAEVGLVFLIFFVQGGWPVPGVNETHYLTKAKHYWNPSWCPGDLFLDSHDAHQVFSWTCGWLTCLLSLPAVAWCGRLLTWGLLAWAWCRLSFALVPRPLLAVLSAGLLVAGTGRAHLAGEWLIGGFEAKGLAYVFVLLALAALAAGRWRAVWPLLGLASAFHVLVGGWSVLAAGVAWITAGRERPKLSETIGSLALGFLLALPGLIPVALLNWGVDPDVISEANRIYVFQRLPHHLVPQAFAPMFVFRHILLAGFWLVLCLAIPADGGDRRLRWFVGATIAFSLIGCLIAWLTLGNDLLAASLLRYYWFRMADILVPLGVAIEVIRGLALLDERQAAWTKWAVMAAIFPVALHLTAVVVERQIELRPQSDSRVNNLADWRQVCEWAAANTPSDALFLTPRDTQSFHWYAGRSEVCSYKDIPQDAVTIVEWWHRVNEIYRQQVPGIEGNANPNELGRARLQALAEKYHIDYLIAGPEPPLAFPRVGPINRTFVVYRLPGVKQRTSANGATPP